MTSPLPSAVHTTVTEHGPATICKIEITPEVAIQGFCSPHTGVKNYLGIKYGAIPARFRQAKAVDILEQAGTIDATRYGPRCPQPIDTNRENRDHLYGGVRASKFIPVDEFECLRLNVYAPGTQSSQQLLPVLVWIHGGGWTVGDGNSEYDGNWLVQEACLLGKPFIYVGINYRLGYYGHLISQELEEEARGFGEAAPVNVGLYDQRLALLWVQKYIRFFGGDPAQVTLAGSSAGAWSVIAHIRSNVPVCQRALVMSAPAWKFRSVAEEQKPWDGLVKYAGVESGTSTEKLAALRKLKYEDLERCLNGTYVKPLWDPNWFIGQQRHEWLESLHEFPDWIESVVVGWCKDEFSLFGLHWLERSSAEIQTAMRAAASDAAFAEEVIAAYSVANDAPGRNENAVSGLFNFITDSIFVSVPIAFAQAGKGKTPVSLYRFDQHDEYPQTMYKSYAFHGLDHTFFCRLPAVAGKSAPKEMQATADAFSRGFTDLIHGQLPWDAYSEEKKIMRIKGSESGLVEWHGGIGMMFLNSREREDKFKAMGQKILWDAIANATE